MQVNHSAAAAEYSEPSDVVNTWSYFLSERSLDFIILQPFYDEII